MEKWGRYLRCGGVGVSQRRVSHGSRKIKNWTTSNNNRAKGTLFLCLLALERANIPVKLSEFRYSIYNLPPSPNKDAQLRTTFILRTVKTFFSSD